MSQTGGGKRASSKRKGAPQLLGSKKTNGHAAQAPKSNGHSAASDMELVRVLDDENAPTLGEEPKWSRDTAQRMYRAMLANRMVDERLITLQRQGRIGFHIGSVGEEAAIIGSVAAMKEADWVFPCYRESGAALYRGMSIETLLHNMYGTQLDPVKGRQMPCHWFWKPGNMPSVSSPIGTQITHAVGAAWAAKLKRDPIATLTYFGDGATSSNEFHVAMNFAGVFQTPTVFLCRNNQWAISVPFDRQTGSESVAVKGVAYGVPGVRVDGNDLLAVYNATSKAAERARRGGGPTLIEAVTYRLEGHSTSDDPRVYRPEAAVEPWRQRDPIARMKKYLEAKSWWTSDDEAAERVRVEADIRGAVATAEATPAPELSSMFDDVYAELPWHLHEQRDQLLSGPRAPKY